MDDIDQGLLDEVSKLVASVLKGSTVVDVDQLCVDIWLELWLARREHASRWFVKRRVIDALRASRRQPAGVSLDNEDEVVYDPRVSTRDSGQHRVQCDELVNQLMRGVRDRVSRALIYERFYLDLTLEQIAERHQWSREAVRLSVERVVMALRQEANRKGLSGT
jgi:DNA-directed RNA polymerase specialized sigma24 family protein